MICHQHPDHELQHEYRERKPERATPVSAAQAKIASRQNEGCRHECEKHDDRHRSGERVRRHRLVTDIAPGLQPWCDELEIDQLSLIGRGFESNSNVLMVRRQTCSRFTRIAPGLWSPSRYVRTKTGEAEARQLGDDVPVDRSRRAAFE